MADAVPRTPEEDRPRLTREELESLRNRIDRAETHQMCCGQGRQVGEFEQECCGEPVEGISIEKLTVLDLLALAQRTVAAEATLAAICEAVISKRPDGSFRPLSALTQIHRLLQEG